MGTNLYRGHPSWRSPIMLRFVAASTFATVIIGLIVSVAVKQDLLAKSYGILGVLVLAGFAFGSSHLFRKKTEYLVTNRGVRFESGFPVKTNKREFSYHKIQAVQVHQTLLEKLLLRTGTVMISSAASDLSQDDIVFDGVAQPDRIAQLIRDGEDRASAPQGGYEDSRPARYAPPSRPPMPIDYRQEDRSRDDDRYGYGPGGLPPR
jgi:uncharacterized membrane protein YdbT with pleckstrin-like domain